jgi:hypothetical protein
MPEQRRARMGVNCRCEIPLQLVFANVVLLGEHSAAMTTVWQGQHTRTPHYADNACSLSHWQQHSIRNVSSGEPLSRSCF